MQDALPRPIGLNPGILREDKPVQLLTEVLYHVVPLCLTMNEKIKADLLLETDHFLNLLFYEVFVFGLRDFSFAKFGTSSSDFFRLLICSGQDNS